MTADESTCNGGSKLEVEPKLDFELRSEAEANGVSVGDGKFGGSNGVVVVVNGGLEAFKEGDEVDLVPKAEADAIDHGDEGFVGEIEQNLLNVCSGSILEPVKEAACGREVDKVNEENDELILENTTVLEGSSVSAEGLGAQGEQVKEAEFSDNLIQENLESQSTHDVEEKGRIDYHGKIEGDENSETHEGEYMVENHISHLADNENQVKFVETGGLELGKNLENGITTEETCHEAAPIDSSNEVEEKPEYQTTQSNNLAVACALDDDEKREREGNFNNGGTLHEEANSLSQVEDQEEGSAVGRQSDGHQESVLAENADNLQLSETAIGHRHDSVESEAVAQTENQNSNKKEELKPALFLAKQVVQDPDLAANIEQDRELAPATELPQECQTCISENSEQTESESAAVMELLQVSQASFPENSEHAETESAAIIELQQSSQTPIPGNYEKTEFESASLQQVAQASSPENSDQSERESAAIVELQQASQNSTPEKSEEVELESAAIIELQQAPQTSIPESSKEVDREESVATELQQVPQVSIPEKSEHTEEESTVVRELQQAHQAPIPGNSEGSEQESAAVMELLQPMPQASIHETSDQSKLESVVNGGEEHTQTKLESVADVSERQKLQSSCAESLSFDSSISKNASLSLGTDADNNMGSDRSNGVEDSKESNLEALDSSKLLEVHENGFCIVTEKNNELTDVTESAEYANGPSTVEIAGPPHICSSTVPIDDSNQLNVINARDTDLSVNTKVEDGSFDNLKVSNGHHSDEHLNVKCISGDEGTAINNLIVNHFATMNCETVTNSEFINCDEVESITRAVEDEQLVNMKETGVVSDPVIETETQHVEEIGPEHLEPVEVEHLEHIEAENVVKDRNEKVEEIEIQHVEDNKVEHIEQIGTEHAEEVEPQRVETEPKPSDELQAGTNLSSKTSDGEKVDTPVVKRQPCYIIKIPRFNNDELWTRMQNIQLEMEEKTQNRDSINTLMQKQKITCTEYQKKYKAAQEEEVAARDAFRSTREKLEPIQSKLSKLKSAHSLEELDNKIQATEYALQHETMPLKEEKKYIHELKLLRQQRELISSSIGPKVELDEAFAKKEQLNDEIKALMKELDSLRTNMFRAETNTKAAWKRYTDEQKVLNDLRKQFSAANDFRQKSYEQLRKLKSESFENNKYFHMYRNDVNAAENLKYSGDIKGLRLHCNNQMEKVMELWNNNEQFRKHYVESNKNSTLRRLRTLDGRSLGPDEEPPLLQNYRINFPNLPSSSKTNVTVPPALEAEPELPEEKRPVPVLQSLQKSKPAKTKSSAKPSSKDLKETSRNIDVDKVQVELAASQRELLKEEEEKARQAEEFARKEEEYRKAKAAAELKEKQRLEQRMKAKEAEERKKRQAEKAQARAEQWAKKEAEFKGKRKAKKDKKKGSADNDATNDDGVGSPAIDITPSETSQVLENSVQTSPRKPSRSLAAAKQYNKVQPVPLPLRNRARRKTRTWMWVILSTLVVILLFVASNYASFNMSLSQFSS